MEDLKAKQDYLCHEIIEANYDAEEFQDYIEGIKGLNLEAYSMEELVDIVQTFKRGGEEAEEFLKKKTSEKEEKEKEGMLPINPKGSVAVDESELSQLKSSIPVPKRGDSINSSTKIYHQIFQKVTFPNLYKRVHEKKEKIRAKIRSYTKSQQDSLFRSSYVAYSVQTSAAGWSVKRRFKDFEWLHSKLSQMYPGLPIPPIPYKTTIRYFDDKHLQERMVIFQNFLNKLIRIPEICSDQILQEFLCASTAQELSMCKQRFEIKLSNKGNKIYSIKGQDVINMSQFAIDPKDSEFYRKSHDLILMLNGQIAAFEKSLRVATEKAFELSSTFAEVSRHFSNRPGMRGGQILQLMGDFINEVGYKLDGQYFFVRNNIQNYWAYEQKYLQTLVSSMAKSNKEQFEMLNKYKNVASAADEIETEEAIVKNKLLGEYMLNKELYRIKLSFLMQEVDRYEREDFLTLAGDWTESLKTYMGGVRDLMLSGADQLTRAMCLAQGKKLVQVQYISKKHPQRQGLSTL